MNLIDQQRYTLPDHTTVVAVEQVSGVFRLDDLTDEPRYLQDYRFAERPWRRVLYNAAIDIYQIVPCDLATDDLTPL